MAAAVDGARIIAADAEPQNWLSHGRTYSEQRFSPLTQINAQNVAGLGLAWYVDLNSKRALEATPLVVDGILYTSTIWNVILAVDAATGEELWRYDPQSRRDWIRYVCCGPVNRGVAAWQGKIITATIDGRLVAIDAANGQRVWETRTTDPDQPYSITGAPRVVNGKVIIGNGGAEYGVRGYVTAYDADNGDQIWRFYTVPGNPALGFENAAMEMAAKTWSGEWWKYGGGGTAWDSFAFDPELNLLYIGTGNGGPWSRDLRSPGGGDNLFLSSIVAVDADTGEYAWHYQTTPGENWDFTAAQQMILAELEIDGAQRKVLMQAPKNGFFYVLDRATGELLAAEKIVPINWATHVDMATGRPVEIKQNLYTDQAKLIMPGPNGSHDWQPMSYHPDTGLVYISIQEMSWAYSRDPDFQFKPFAWNAGLNPAAEAPPGAADAVSRGSLLAWDPVRQTRVWEVDLGYPWNGGVLSTAGNLVIEGAADGRFVIYQADTGDVLWELPIQTGAVAGPVTYMVNGEQYIAVAAGWGGAFVLMGGGAGPLHQAPSRLLAFKLGGTAQLPEPPPPPVMPEPPASTADPEMIAAGEGLYMGLCGNCHGFYAISGGTVSDLRYMSAETHTQFSNIVLGGTRLGNGMPAFNDVLSEDDLAKIHAYIIHRANETWEG
jgi:quinohemoprotein ethanol dehydrogenase